MYRDLRITGFRGFKDFRMHGLGRVNLLLGGNNCGKTSVLEAICLLGFGAEPIWLGWMADRRELMGTSIEGKLLLEVAHLFHGHAAEVGTEFSIAATRQDAAAGPDAGAAETLTARIYARPPNENDLWRKGFRWLELSHDNGARSSAGMTLTPQGSWARHEASQSRFGRAPVEFLFDSFEPRDGMMALLAKILHTPEEEQVLSALRLIAPDIEGIGIGPAMQDESGTRSKDGIYLKLSGQKRRIPISSLGEGLWRLLSLSLGLLSSRGGVLVVDDIDTGLHYSVMLGMWQHVLTTARRLEIQVFATTHSRDCLEALAQLAGADTTESRDITLQRLERDQTVAHAYGPDAIVAAGERGAEG